MAAPLASCLAVIAVLSGCSSAPHTAGAASTPPAGSSSTAPSDQQATALLTHAASTLAAVKSYRFDAVQTVAAKTPVTSRVTGAVVRNEGVAYTLTAGKATTQVIRIKAATYVRKPPGHWAKLAKPRPVADPTTSLAAILHGLTGVRTVDAATVAGTLSDSGAKTAGIPTGSEPAQVTVTVDGGGHVSRVTVHTTTQAGTAAVAVTLVTTYSSFDRVPALHRPV